MLPERDLVTLEPDEEPAAAEEDAGTSSALLSASAATRPSISLFSLGLYPQKNRSSNHANRPARTTDCANESTSAGRRPSIAAWPIPTCAAQARRWTAPAAAAGEERKNQKGPVACAHAVAASHIGRARKAVQLTPAKRSRNE